MTEAAHIPRHLTSLRKKLDLIEGVRTELASGPEICVEFQGRRIGTWASDGHELAGQFACENVLLCADTADEACRLTVNRLN
jgi:hypothetical protein